MSTVSTTASPLGASGGAAATRARAASAAIAQVNFTARL